MVPSSFLFNMFQLILPWIVPWMLPWYFSNIFKSRLRPHQPFSVDAASRGQWHAAHPVAPPPGVSMTRCRIQKPQKEQNHHNVCNRICVFFWSFWGCYYIISPVLCGFMWGFMWFHHSISGGFYVHICSFHPPTFEESKSCGVPAECWHLSKGVRDHRRWVHHYFQMGVIDFDISKTFKSSRASMSCWPKEWACLKPHLFWLHNWIPFNMLHAPIFCWENGDMIRIWSHSRKYYIISEAKY